MTAFITKHKNKIFIALAVSFWIFVWQAASAAVGYSFLLSSPLDVIKALFRLCGERAFWLSVIGSILRISSGFFAALLIGIVLSCLAARFKFIEILLLPFMATIKSMPVASLTVLLLLWLSSSQSLASVISFIMVLPLIYNTVFNGLNMRDTKLSQMSKVFKISKIKKLLYIDFPQVIPHITSVCSVALGLAWKSGVAAEVIGIIDNSLGGAIYSSKLLLSTQDVLAFTVVVIALSFIFEKLVTFLLSLLTKVITKGGKR